MLRAMLSAQPCVSCRAAVAIGFSESRDPLTPAAATTAISSASFRILSSETLQASSALRGAGRS